MFKMNRICRDTIIGFGMVWSSLAMAGIEGSISGSVTDAQGIAVPAAVVELQSMDGKHLETAKSSTTGEFQFFSVIFGDYQVKVNSAGFLLNTTIVHVASSNDSQVKVGLVAAAGSEDNTSASAPKALATEMLLEVRAKRNLIQHSGGGSSTQINQEMIKRLPQGEQVSLPQLISSTTPGVVQGAFGQMFIRGNHGNIQYQIDGVQMPDSPSSTFGDSFSPRNIDHMEVITGGIPAEYGERLAAVVNIVTKSGLEEPHGEIELNYGTNNRTSPQVTYGGSTKSGDLHYYFSANYNRSDRGLDTPPTPK